MTYPSPIYLGQFEPVVAGDATDEFIDLENDLVTGETVTSVAYTVTTSAGATVAGAVSTSTESGTRSDFRYSLASAGVYTLKAVFTISDGQTITRTATLWAV